MTPLHLAMAFLAQLLIGTCLFLVAWVVMFGKTKQEPWERILVGFAATVLAAYITLQVWIGPGSP